MASRSTNSTNHVTAAGRKARNSILEAVADSPRGWLSYTELSAITDMSEGSVRYHVLKLRDALEINTGKLSVDGIPGRPLALAIDPSRIYDIELTLPDPFHGTSRTAQIDLDPMPHEQPPPAVLSTSRIGPVSAALQEGVIDHDELARAISSTVAEAIIRDLQLGNTRLIIEANPASQPEPTTATETPDTPDTPDTGDSNQ